MLLEKNTLFGLLVDWFTGCSAVSPGHSPFCASASTSVPGAPASSLVTGIQLEVLNLGVEICAPVAAVLALLSTLQPPAPRLEMSLAPVADGDAAAGAGCRAPLPWVPAAAGAARALDAAASDATPSIAAVQNAELR